MNEKPEMVKDTTARDMAVRTQALQMAITAQCGLVYDADSKAQYSEIEIVKAAMAFENYIKGIKQEDKPDAKW